MNSQNQARIEELEKNPNRTPEDEQELSRLKKAGEDRPQGGQEQTNVSRPQGDVTRGTNK